MYRLFISSPDDDKYGIKTGLTPCEFYLSSADDVCEVLKTFNSKNMLFTLTEIKLVSVVDIKRYFKLIP